METKNDGSDQKSAEKATGTIETMAQDLKNETKVDPSESQKLDSALSESLMKEMEKAASEETGVTPSEPISSEKPAELTTPTENPTEIKAGPVQIINPNFNSGSGSFVDPKPTETAVESPEIPAPVEETTVTTEEKTEVQAPVAESMPPLAEATPIISFAAPIIPQTAPNLASTPVFPETKLPESESLIEKIQDGEKKDILVEDPTQKTSFCKKNKLIVILLALLILMLGAALGFYLLKKDLFMSLLGLSS